MDYLFYGSVTTTRQTSTTVVSLHIYCEPNETIRLYELSPDASHHLTYKPVRVERGIDGLIATLSVQEGQLSLFVIAGQSNEIDIPFEATYAVYNGEVVSLPENNVVQLEGATSISSVKE